jgi:hypothetical protein
MVQCFHVVSFDLLIRIPFLHDIVNLNYNDTCKQIYSPINLMIS